MNSASLSPPPPPSCASLLPELKIRAEVQMESRPCALCAKPASLLCARCLEVAFCDATCQRGAWRDHKPLCFPAATSATAMVKVTHALSPERKATSTLPPERKAKGAPPPELEAKNAPPLELPTLSMSFERVIALMKSHPDDARLVHQGIERLYALAQHGKELTQIACDAVGAIISALRLHPENRSVAEVACFVLWVFGTFPNGRAILATADAPATVIKVLHLHAESKLVCTYVGGIIRTIFQYVDETADSSVAMWSLDGHVRQGHFFGVTAMGPLSASLCLQTHDRFACEAIINAICLLCQFAGGREIALAVDTITPLAAALATHGADVEACGTIVSAFCIICFLPAAAAAVCNSANVVKHLIVALSTHPTDLKICNAAVLVLYIIAIEPAGAAALRAEEGLVPQLVAAARHYDKGRFPHASGTLRMLGFSDDGVALTS